MAFVIFSLILAIFSLIEKRALFFISIICIAFYFSFTYGYGYDWMNYRDSYNNILSKNQYYIFFVEPGFFIFMKSFAFIGVSFHFFNSFIVLLSYFFIFLFCVKRENPCFSLFVVFSFFGYFALSEWIRQGLALSIILYACDYIQNKKKFFILISIALLFHIGAIVTFIYPLIGKNSKRNMMFSLVLSFAMMSIIVFSLYNPDYFSSIPIIGKKISDYNYLLTSNGQESAGFFDYILQSRLSLVYIFLFFLVLRKSSQENRMYTASSATFLLLLSRFASSLVRVGYYFVPLLVVSIDRCMSLQGKGNKTNLYKILFVLVIFSISTIPFWNPVFWHASENFLTLFSTPYEINIEISRKCAVINYYYEHHAIWRCN